MIDRNTPVTEDELHAYVDGELPAARREAVEAWLQRHPEDAARVGAWRAQAEAIRARYGAVASEPAPERLALDRIVRRRRSWGAIAAAAVVVAFIGGGAVGWMARGASAAAPGEVEVFTKEALQAHRLYIGEVRHPIEVKAEENHLLPWLSRRVGTTLRAPDLGNFDLKLLGGRLLPGVRGPAALFMYESASVERVTLYCSRIEEAQAAAFHYSSADKIGAVRWIEGGYGWVLSGPEGKLKLKEIAVSAYEQVENRTPTPSRGSATQLMSRRGS